MTTNRVRELVVGGASEHNLQNISLRLPRGSLTVFTGVSGSGKSSLAFDTIYREGQRRFLESFSAYARQFLGQLEKPRVEHVEGIGPTIAIEQKRVGRNPRSTVGTITELYDHYRLLYARLGQPHCPQCDRVVRSLTPEQVVEQFHLDLQRKRKTLTSAAPGNASTAAGGFFHVYAPMVRDRKGEYRKELAEWLEAGYLRARIDGQLRRLDEPITLARYEKHQIDLLLDRIAEGPAQRTRLLEGVERAFALSGGLVTMDYADGPQKTYSGKRGCPHCGTALPELEPRLFSFNDPQGACSACRGLGEVRSFTLPELIDATRSLQDGALRFLIDGRKVPFARIERDDLLRIAAELFDLSPRLPWKDLPPEGRQHFLQGNLSAETALPSPHAVFHRGGRLVRQALTKGEWVGLLPLLEIIAAHTGSLLDRYRQVRVCSACQGARLGTLARSVRFRETRLHELSALTIEEAERFFRQLRPTKLEEHVGAEVFREIHQRLRLLCDVGVDYLTVDRPAGTLSGGEAQRIRLAAQLGAKLRGVLYVLDEPSIGLHQADNRRLLRTLEGLRDLGNTVFVVEHDEETMVAADHIVDMGPGAGKCGGELLAEGDFSTICAHPRSLTGKYLSGRRSIAVPATRRSPRGWLEIEGANLHNLQDFACAIPLGVLVAITGVSGSGKSSLVHEVLSEALQTRLQRKTPFKAAPFKAAPSKASTSASLPAPSLPEHCGQLRERLEGGAALDKLIRIDQAPIGRTPRSNAATYTKVFDAIRQLFSSTSLARARGYAPGRFSFNVKGGRCETCLGAGVRSIEMQFLSKVLITCETCQGSRFNTETLEIRYKDQRICDVLNMTVDEATACFVNVPAVHRTLETLQQVGLGYLPLGQPSTTLSGGEAQRVKLASELRKPGSGNTLYVLDEPTTGLHFEDIGQLLRSLNQLVEQGNTVLVIEHNLDVIKTADHLLDLGPGGGAAGGKLVCAGTPEEVARCVESLTGQALRPLLQGGSPTKRNQPGRNQPERNQPERWAQEAAPAEIVAENSVKNAAKTPVGAEAFDVDPDALTIRGARQHNLKHVDLQIPHGKLTVITGVSGCGKTSLAFDTIFSEGQARYVESLSTYARRFLGRMDKPRVDSIHGLAPAIAIHQGQGGRSPRSTVATTTEIYDYLRLLYARVGRPHSPTTGEPLLGWSASELARQLLEQRPLKQRRSKQEPAARVIVCAPLYRADQTHRGPSKPAASPASAAEDAVWLPLETPAELLSRRDELLRAGLTQVFVDDAPWELEALAPKVLRHCRVLDLRIDRMTLRPSTRQRLAEAIDTAYAWGQGLVRLRFVHGSETPAASKADPPQDGVTAPLLGDDLLLSRTAGSPRTREYIELPMSPRQFSFNHHEAACPQCSGLGKQQRIRAALLVNDPELPLFEGAIQLPDLRRRLASRMNPVHRGMTQDARRTQLRLDRPFASFSAVEQKRLLWGGSLPREERPREERQQKRSLRGLIPLLQAWAKEDESGERRAILQRISAEEPCTVCQGQRLKPLALGVTIDGLHISQFCALTVDRALETCSRWRLSEQERQIAEQPLREVQQRLEFLQGVGLGYLSLDRQAATLSGGEAQRIRLACQLGAQLSGVLYVLDEPTVGLHPRDVGRLLTTLKQFVARDNTVILVEHDLNTIREADHVVDLGPGAGQKGGEVIACGTPTEIAAAPRSLTGDYLAGRKCIPLPKKRRSHRGRQRLKLLGARANNLKKIDVEFPLGLFTVITGVSGSGKSTLMMDVLRPVLAHKLEREVPPSGLCDDLKGAAAIDRLVVIDQRAIGRSPKSNAATYSGAMTAIRNCFASTMEAKKRGYTASRFSYNVASGRCAACDGYGLKHIEMHFLPDVWVPCEVCQGARYNPGTLEVRFKGRTIAEILQMEIAQVAPLFAAHRRVHQPLQSLCEVGLGYMALGQGANTLSGGEAQRLKLARELAAPSDRHTLYLLDEPTTGLHLDDTAKLLAILQRLVDQGHTVMLIEHHLELIRAADHVIDLGPEGGDAGGNLVAQGTPTQVARMPKSFTGQALKKASEVVNSSSSPRTRAGS